jgi:3-hydroxyisobutyrate dehydrogenase-like beta-hydroxyacid dehydrogenase
MPDTPTKIVVDCSTGEQQILELTAEEIAQRDQDAADAAARREEEEAAAAALATLKASAKAKLVAGTPLTEEEAATLVI